jgi:hypothetical protein
MWSVEAEFQRYGILVPFLYFNNETNNVIDPSAIMAPKTIQLHSVVSGKKLKTLHGHV